MALVAAADADLVEALPKKSRASQWDEPQRDPKTGNPFFFVKNMAPNPEGYCFWKNTQAPKGLNEHGYDFEGRIDGQASPLQMVLGGGLCVR